jgi:YtxH-like protein
MKANDLVNYMTDVFPYKRKSSIDWIVPASVGLGLGITFGVGLGVLIAPTSGEQTRRRLRDSAERAKERAMEAAQRTKERAMEAAQKTKEQLQESSTGVNERPFAHELGGVR